MIVKVNDILNVTTEDYNYQDSSITDQENDGNFISDFQLVLYCLVFSIGFIGNVLVIFVLVCSKKLNAITDIYLLNMAFSDFLFVFSLPFLAYNIKNQWVFGNGMCKILSSLYFIGFFSSIFFITVMSVDRYLAIVHAVYALKVRTLNWGIIISILVWIVSILFSTPHFIFHVEDTSASDYTSCIQSFPEGQKTPWLLFVSFQLNIFGLIIPLGILIFCYSHIIKNLQNSKCKQKRCAIRLILIVVVAFFLFWVPYNIVIFASILQTVNAIDDDLESKERLEMAMDITRSVSLIHCCLNPIIYAFVGEKFKNYLHLLFNKPLSCIYRHTVPGHIKSTVTDQSSSTIRSTRVSFSSEAII
ncbi:C-C chemokine receptor type 8-like [Rhinophrynus dorsalis]